MKPTLPKLTLAGTVGKPTLTCARCAHTWQPAQDKQFNLKPGYRVCPGCGQKHAPVTEYRREPDVTLKLTVSRRVLGKLIRIVNAVPGIGGVHPRTPERLAVYMIRNAVTAFPL